MIYFDYHAASPLCEEARHAMQAYEGWANPSSVHGAGRQARRALESARDLVAGCLGAAAPDVVLTAGGTEACNLAILGASKPVKRIVCSQVEHPAVARAVDEWESRGADVSRLRPSDGAGPSVRELEEALVAGADLVVLQWVNHETGSVSPIEEYGQICAKAGVALVVDGTQALGRIPIDVSRLGVQALMMASHKMGGPAGAGALWVHPSWPLEPQMRGGGQERGRRAGTPDVRAAVGFGAACGALATRLEAMPRVTALRDRLEKALVRAGGVVNGASGARVGSVTNCSFRGWRGELLVVALDVEGLCASSGPACSAGIPEPSPTVSALYPTESWRAESALRLSLGPETTEAEVTKALSILERVLPRGCA